jgi:hypothetical protein
LPHCFILSFAPEARVTTFEENQMKRVEFSDIGSNVLLISAVMVALAPFLFGDQLLPLVQNGLRELSLFFNDMSTFVIKALS